MSTRPRIPSHLGTSRTTGQSDPAVVSKVVPLHPQKQELSTQTEYLRANEKRIRGETK